MESKPGRRGDSDQVLGSIHGSSASGGTVHSSHRLRRPDRTRPRAAPLLDARAAGPRRSRPRDRVGGGDLGGHSDGAVRGVGVGGERRHRCLGGRCVRGRARVHPAGRGGERGVESLLRDVLVRGLLHDRLESGEGRASVVARAGGLCVGRGTEPPRVHASFGRARGGRPSACGGTRGPGGYGGPCGR